MLAAGIDAEDPVAAQSICALAEERMAPVGAEALLRAAAAEATGTFLVRVAQALHVLTGDESWAGPVASVLGSDEFWGVRIDAAMALARFAPTAELIRTLGEAVRDPEYLVRYHAANTLLRYAGRAKKDVWSYPELFRKIASPRDGEATEPDRLRWDEAADQLTAEALRKSR
jgi:hypothetical protein